MKILKTNVAIIYSSGISTKNKEASSEPWFFLAIFEEVKQVYLYFIVLGEEVIHLVWSLRSSKQCCQKTWQNKKLGSRYYRTLDMTADFGPPFVYTLTHKPLLSQWWKESELSDYI